MNYIDFPFFSNPFGISSITHLVGQSTTDPKGELGATVNNHSNWSVGDIVFYNSKEYILSAIPNSAENWIEIGDENIDQSYDGMSINAQSGKAVSEAVAQKADKTEVDKLKDDLVNLENLLKQIQDKLNQGIVVDNITVNEINNMIVEYFESKIVSEVEG